MGIEDSIWLWANKKMRSTYCPRHNIISHWTCNFRNSKLVLWIIRIYICNIIMYGYIVFMYRYSALHSLRVTTPRKQHTHLSPRALRRKRSGTAREQPFSGGQQYFDEVVTVLNALAFYQTHLHLVFGGRPSGGLDHFQIVQVQTIYVVSVGKKTNKYKVVTSLFF